MLRRTTLKNKLKLTASILALPMSFSSIAAPAQAQVNDEIIVTATRRDESVQDIPFNISAVSAAELDEIGITDLAELSAWVPGFHIINSGGREVDGIVIRGLNADGLGAANNNGTVETYIGEIPLFVDLKMNDMKQIEVLLGPQGTLYGAGTMGGAVRYIPNKPDFEEELFSLRADAYAYSKGSGISTDVGLTANVPVSDNFALRMNIDYLKDDGYIDYVNVVNQIGFTNPDDPNGVHTVEDANKEDTFSLRFAARWAPTDAIDATLTYYGQFQDVDARSHNGYVRERAPDFYVSGPYESATRVLEPNKRDDQLVALEVIADLGFAELTSATGFGKYDELGNRDQTDLLVGLQYSYESFPNFTAITEEAVQSQFFNQEVRLVSTGDKWYNWIIGAYYNETETQSLSHEFTPNHPFSNRDDDLEYDAFSNSKDKEMALFGEVGFDLTEAWQVTLGGRYFEYDLKSVSDAIVPFFAAASYEQSTLEGIKQLAFDPVNDAKDDGTLFKINTSYAVTEDVNVYATISEGFRLGGSNGIQSCPDVLPTTQILCALPDEQNYAPDTTTNYEVGVKSTLMDGRLTLNGALYMLDWEGILLAGATVNGTLPILQNGGSAQSKGVEVSFDYAPTDTINIRGNYAYTNAELTSDAPDLYSPNAFYNVDAGDTGGVDGDRLPGSPEHQFSLFGDYTYGLESGQDLVYRAGVSYTSDILQRVGSIANGETLDGYFLANMSLSYVADNWDLTVYANNLFDEYAETTITGTSASIQTYRDGFGTGGTHLFRGFRPTPIAPRVVGMRATYSFK
ncbi:outer membrane receptor protein involved in Fe transport [Litorimonas taeanensis]|uniref:Outer membrane receptor protein involved in Fe transport n=1 Tax=Litorimonas taeanensis TaxID=568099 RepID=A0A420WLU9_9PROT|nr:TonB-dependent receptor [Litorimonas taeanensis]RKQ71876.1 outer membrane receptor protein involved in Fe transport [Litorimonas taeanensis]